MVVELTTFGCQACAHEAARRIQFIGWILPLLPPEKMEAIRRFEEWLPTCPTLAEGAVSPTLRRG
jgi:hypothetical protein